jgi:hypothetical protein
MCPNIRLHHDFFWMGGWPAYLAIGENCAGHSLAGRKEEIEGFKKGLALFFPGSPTLEDCLHDVDQAVAEAP